MAQAHHKPGHSKGGGASKHSTQKFKKSKRGGPPPWAPAHGYRAKRHYKSADDGKVHEFVPADLVKVTSSGLGKCDRATLGAVLGAAVGSVVGTKIGKGDGKTLATIGGAIIGTLVGGSIGRAMDQVDQNCIGQVLERAPTATSVTWRDSKQSADYSVTPTRTYRRGDGRYCRDYQTQIVIDGRLENAHGTACRRADGTWEKAA
jgi:surface antigen